MISFANIKSKVKHVLILLVESKVTISVVNVDVKLEQAAEIEAL